MAKELTSIRISKDTVSLLNELEVKLWWVDLRTQDDKIKHLIWFFSHYENSNWKK